MNADVTLAVLKQLQSFWQHVETGEVITVLDALHNAGYVIHKKLTLTCADEWVDGEG